MNQSANTLAVDGNPNPPPLSALRDQLTQTMTSANQLRSILATVDDPGRRLGEIR